MDLSDKLEVVVRSDPGRIRGRNEDAVYANASLGLAILADGMGGYNAGDVASGMAVAMLSDRFASLLEGNRLSELDDHPAQLIDAAVSEANVAILSAAQRQPQYAGMGTTLVIAWFLDNRVYLAHLGDSRCYRWRDGALQLMTRDHSLLQEQLDSGMIRPEDARHAEYRNLVTRALGIEPVIDVEITEHAARPGDVFLLCSDGLNDMLEDVEIAALLARHGADLGQAAEMLIEEANDHGGRDNVSVILVGVLQPFAAPRGWWQRLLAKLK